MKTLALVLLVMTLAALPARAEPMTKSDLATYGVIAVLGGAVLAAPGFAILGACRQGSSCYSPGLRTVGWILAAPGIAVVLVGVGMIALSGAKLHGMAAIKEQPRWIVGATAGPGGGGLYTTFRF